MDELEREDMRRDMEIDAQYSKYKVIVTVEVERTVSATDKDDAEDQVFDEIRDVFRGSRLDYDCVLFESDEVE